MIHIKYVLNGKRFDTFTNGLNDFVCTITALRSLGAIVYCQIKGGSNA